MSLIEKTTEIGNSIIALIDAKTGGAPDGKTVKSTDGIMSAIGVKESNKDKAIKTWVGTLEEYEALESVDENTLYNITDDVEGEEVFTTTKVNLDGSNYEGSGLQTVVDSNLNSKMTNCITEIPQRIKLELNDGVLTLKAGSVVIVPNGFKEDGTTLKFDEVEITSDKTLTYSWSTPNDGMQLFMEVSSGALSRLNLGRIVSGDTDSYTGTYSHIWYNTTTNKVNWVNTDGSLDIQLSLPIAKFTAVGDDTATVTSIDQVFNGMGYIGSTIWVDKGVKFLVPNGRNTDGTLNNTELTTTQLRIRKMTYAVEDGYIMLNHTRAVELVHANALFTVYDTLPVPNTYYERCYVEVENQQYYHIANATTWEKITEWGIAGVATSATDGVISNFKPKQPFRAIDYSDSSTVSSWAMPSDKYIDLTLGATGTTYTAPANGWYLLAKGLGTNASIELNNKTSHIADRVLTATADTRIGKLYIPVRKGDTVGVYYTNTGTTELFRFIYAQGEV